MMTSIPQCLRTKTKHCRHLHSANYRAKGWLLELTTDSFRLSCDKVLPMFFQMFFPDTEVIRGAELVPVAGERAPRRKHTMQNLETRETAEVASVRGCFASFPRLHFDRSEFEDSFFGQNVKNAPWKNRYPAYFRLIGKTCPMIEIKPLIWGVHATK